MHVPIRLAEVGIGEADIDSIINKLVTHGMTNIGEHGDITPEVSRTILVQAL